MQFEALRYCELISFSQALYRDYFSQTCATFLHRILIWRTTKLRRLHTVYEQLTAKTNKCEVVYVNAILFRLLAMQFGPQAQLPRLRRLEKLATSHNMASQTEQSLYIYNSKCQQHRPHEKRNCTKYHKNVLTN